jgi:hypothetical protein
MEISGFLSEAQIKPCPTAMHWPEEYSPVMIVYSGSKKSIVQSAAGHDSIGLRRCGMQTLLSELQEETERLLGKLRKLGWTRQDCELIAPTPFAEPFDILVHVG